MIDSPMHSWLRSGRVPSRHGAWGWWCALSPSVAMSWARERVVSSPVTVFVQLAQHTGSLRARGCFLRLDAVLAPALDLPGGDAPPATGLVGGARARPRGRIVRRAGGRRLFARRGDWREASALCSALRKTARSGRAHRARSRGSTTPRDPEPWPRGRQPLWQSGGDPPRLRCCT